MALTVNHPTLREVMVSVSCPSVAVTGAVRAPFRGKVVKVGAVLGGAITGGAAVITATIITAAADGAAPGAGNAITTPTFSISNTNSAAGSGNGVVPTAANSVNEDDIITFAQTGATGASTVITYWAVIRTA